MNPFSRLICPTLFGLFAVLCVGTQSTAALKVAKANSAITIDGKADDTAWEKAEKCSFDNFNHLKEKDDRQATTFRMLWDDTNLYFLFECEDKYLNSFETLRNGAPYLDDCAEIFLTPAPARKDMHMGFEVNLHKAINDFIYIYNFHDGQKAAIKSFDPDFLVEVSLDGTLNDNSDIDRSWTMEMAIPLKLFLGVETVSPVVPGNRWTFQALRQERNGPTPGRRCWSTLFPMPKDKSDVHNPEYFDFIEFVDAL